MLLSIAPFLFNSPVYVAVTALVVVGLGALARSLKSYVRVRYLPMLFLVVTFAAWQFYLTGATVVARLGPLTLTREALLYASPRGSGLSRS